MPYEGAWENLEYLAFLERIQAEREKAEEKRNQRLVVIATILGVVIAFAAAGASFWSGYACGITLFDWVQLPWKDLDKRPYTTFVVSHSESLRSFHLWCSDPEGSEEYNSSQGVCYSRSGGL
jgi:hypothetical protein